MIINAFLIFDSEKKDAMPHIEPKVSTDILSYIVKDFNGNIAVFNSFEKEPIKVIDVYTASLPVADQEMLLKGISVKNYEELSVLLEDLCS